MSVKKRLKEYISYKKLAIRQFENSINASNSYVNSISKSIGVDKLESIVENYPDLNLKWLLAGKGSMIEDTQKVSHEDLEELTKFLYENNSELMKNENYRLLMEKNVALLNLEKEKENLSKEEEEIKKMIKESINKNQT
ncbi:hypothetical protein [Aquimarina algiphila]|uniref:Helix-turn-helix transcriptional regulator n=1 Tax=Aquimarina algiphila TaxID=2047982 RepID=A0A554VL06_9FLAO|nr:hypothetical protein [Aquimarina algiphila]TSE08787.1 hypothetical protein FOF46_10815 [Aquimarina algiphila]